MPAAQHRSPHIFACSVNTSQAPSGPWAAHTHPQAAEPMCRTTPAKLFLPPVSRAALGGNAVPSQGTSHAPKSMWASKLGQRAPWSRFPLGHRQRPRLPHHVSVRAAPVSLPEHQSVVRTTKQPSLPVRVCWNHHKRTWGSGAASQGETETTPGAGSDAGIPRWSTWFPHPPAAPG